MLGAGPRSGAPGHQFAPRRPLDPGCPAAALRGRGTARRWLECPGKGRLAQRESACFTRKRSLVRNQRRPPKVTGAPSSSGPGRSPLKAEIAGSNPAGATRTQVRQLKLARCPGQAASLVLAGAEGVRPPADEIGKVAASVQQLEPAGLSTLHKDLVGGKQMELEALHGFVVRRAAHHRPGAPMSETVYALLRPHALRRRQVAAFARTLRARCPWRRIASRCLPRDQMDPVADQRQPTPNYEATAPARRRRSSRCSSAVPPSHRDRFN